MDLLRSILRITAEDKIEISKTITEEEFNTYFNIFNHFDRYIDMEIISNREFVNFEFIKKYIKLPWKNDILLKYPPPSYNAYLFILKNKSINIKREDVYKLCDWFNKSYRKK